MSTSTKRALRLAVFVEAVSCLNMLYRDNPVSFWNSWCFSLGWPTQVVSQVLESFFEIINFPVLLLLYLGRGDLGCFWVNGRLVPTSIWLIIAILIQCVLWTTVFFGLLQIEQKIHARIKPHEVEPDVGEQPSIEQADSSDEP